MSYDPVRFADKYLLAQEAALKEKPQGGLYGFELEWNLLDSELRPLLTVGSGPSQHSFVDYLRTECLPEWSRTHSQLEVFHWMVEWATRPYYTPLGAVNEGRLLEAALINALNGAGREFGEKLYFWHGNLLVNTRIDHSSIPTSWSLAKRRYLERCVDLYGESLATAGTHTNLSLPEPLIAWDFMHLTPSERGDQHLDEYKSEFYITATRLMRAFASLYIACSASTPLQARDCQGHPNVALTPYDSVRNLTFPNPPTLDLPDLYRSYADYLQLSYDLVRRGVRFGNNNWTPVRARSFAEPVERLIAVTTDELQEMYARGLYALGETTPDLEARRQEMARQIEIQNLMARINLPMARVEIRTDDGGHPIEVDLANLSLKQLLLARFYADDEFARAFRYDREDITRARRNEDEAARNGLRAVIDNPLTGKPVEMREFLAWVLEEVRPLAEALGMWSNLDPLVEMAAGGPNTSEKMRTRLAAELGTSDEQGCWEVPMEMMRQLCEERMVQVIRDVEGIAATYPTLGPDASKLGEYIQMAREEVRLDPQMPVRFRTRLQGSASVAYPDKTAEVLDLAQALVRIPSVTACPEERLEDVHRAAALIMDYAVDSGLEVRYFDQGKYPALLIGFRGALLAPVMLSGHFDVVLPEPDNNQFQPRIDGDYLWGRGTADMKTVVATNLVWMKDIAHRGGAVPPVNLLLVGNEENGEGEPMGTPHVLQALASETGPDGKLYAPGILIAGERTGEKGNELWGEICIQNRGVMRFDVIARGVRGHSGVAGTGAMAADLTERLLLARATLTGIMGRHLTLSSPDGWQSLAQFPFIQIGTPGIYNVSADFGVLGVEVRSIPQDPLNALVHELREYAASQDLELKMVGMENGVACSLFNPYLQALIQAVRECSGQEPRLGRKLPGTSARFAPGGQGVVWGQTGIGPHSKNERHFIPSILPYYQAVDAMSAQLLKQA